MTGRAAPVGAWVVQDRWQAVLAPWLPASGVYPHAACLEQCPDARDPWACTRPVGHQGRHLARVDRTDTETSAVVAAWPGMVAPSELDLWTVPDGGTVPVVEPRRRGRPGGYVGLSAWQRLAVRWAVRLVRRVEGTLVVRRGEPGRLEVCGACYGQGVRFAPDLFPTMASALEAAPVVEALSSEMADMVDGAAAAAWEADRAGLVEREEADAALGLGADVVAPVLPLRALAPVTRPLGIPLQQMPRAAGPWFTRPVLLGHEAEFPASWWIAEDASGEPTVWTPHPDGGREPVTYRRDVGGPLWLRLAELLPDRGTCVECTTVPCWRHGYVPCDECETSGHNCVAHRGPAPWRDPAPAPRTHHHDDLTGGCTP